MASPFGFGATPGGAYSGLRRSVIDPVTGHPVVTSAPTGEIVKRAPLAPVGIDDNGAMRWALPGLIADAPQSIASAVTLPRDAWRGDFETMPTRMSREEGMRVADAAGLAFTGSLPFKAPAGALRSFGGAAVKDDPLAALEAALTKGIAENPQAPPPGPRRLDPNAASWDLYHGSTPGPDFRRFDPQASSNPAERGAVFFAPNPETASGYAGLAAEGAEAGSRVFRASVEPGRSKVFDLADLAENDPAFTARAREITMDQGIPGHGPLFDDYMAGFRASRAQDREIAAQVREMGYAPGDPSPVSYGWGHIGAAVERAKAEGLDTAVLRGLAEHGGDDQVIALTPGRVRSRYSGDLLYAGAPIGLGVGAAGLSSPDAAQAAPSQGISPVSASPFGFGAPQVRSEDLLRLFQSGSLSAPQGFAPIAENETDAQRLEQAMGMVPPAARPTSARPPLAFGGSQRAQAPAGSMTVPLPPQRPAELQTTQADMPADGAQPIVAQGVGIPAAQGQEESLLDRIMGGIRSSDGLLTSLGIGLMSNAGFGQGIAAGLQAHQQGEGRRAASRLAQAEYGLKARELQRKERGENSTRAFLLSKGMSAEQADAAMANPTVLSSTLSQINKEPSIVEIGGNKYRLGPNDTPSEANLLGPANAPADTTTADQKNYEEAKRGGYPGSFLDYQVLKANAGKAQTTINNAVNPVLKGLGDQFVEGAAGARASADAVRSIQNARSQLQAPGGIYSGAFAENQLALQKLGAAIGVSDPNAIQNTETFRTQIKPIVLDTVKGLGAGSGISNADRDFALQAVGGDIKLDEGTIRRVLDITERSARAKIERHNSLATQMLETQPELRQIAPMLQVEMPAGAMPAAPVTGAKRLRFDPATGAFR